jgi:hypothetical protein
MTAKIFIGVMLLCLCAPVFTFAAQPLATDDTGTLGTAKFQLETGLQLDWDRQDDIRTTSQTVSVTLTCGVFDSLDLVAALPYSWQNIRNNGFTTTDNSGFNDLSLAIKWRFLEAGHFSLALKPAVTIPTANYDRGLGAGRPSYGAALISTVESKPVAIHANVGYTCQKYTDNAKDTGREDLLNLSLAAAVSVTPALQLVAEIGTATNTDSTSSIWPVFLTGGAIYSVIDNLDLDLGIKGGLSKPETDISLLAGATVKF